MITDRVDPCGYPVELPSASKADLCEHFSIGGVMFARLSIAVKDGAGRGCCSLRAKAGQIFIEHHCHS